MLQNQQSVSVFRMLRLQHREADADIATWNRTSPMLKLQHILESGAMLTLQQTKPML